MKIEEVVGMIFEVELRVLIATVGPNRIVHTTERVHIF
jgi:hypothetical protein